MGEDMSNRRSKQGGIHYNDESFAVVRGRNSEPRYAVRQRPTAQWRSAP